MLWQRACGLGAPPVEGLHLTFGGDPSQQMTVSWLSLEAVSRPRVILGTPGGGFGTTFAAGTHTYADAVSGRTVHLHVARLDRLRPGGEYIYAAAHDGARAEMGMFRTAPAGRAPFVFTSFGDMGSPGLITADGVSGRFVNDANGSPNSIGVVNGIERIAPLFNLVNGDLSYANLSSDRMRVWQTWFANVSRSARFRPWMPAAGNHENERGNGPIGYEAYQTLFPVPGNGGEHETRRLWYAFTAGSVRFVVLNNDDVCYQDGGSTYIHGYSGGAQKRWLESELAATRASPSIDWIVVCAHQAAVSTAERANGADLGIRAEWLPLFDRYGVDLVVCGHEHHYERSHPVRGQQPNDTLTPIPRSSDINVADTSAGTVHMVIGSGGTSVPTSHQLTSPPRCRVITSAGPPDAATGNRPPVYVWEDAPWSAFRDSAHPYGFAAFTVDPGTGPGAATSIDVTYYSTGPLTGALSACDSFRLTRRRSDGPGTGLMEGPLTVRSGAPAPAMVILK